MIYEWMTMVIWCDMMTWSPWWCVFTYIYIYIYIHTTHINEHDEMVAVWYHEHQLLYMTVLWYDMFWGPQRGTLAEHPGCRAFHCLFFFSAFPSRCFGMFGRYLSVPWNIVSSDNWDKNAKIPISSTPSLWEETWTRKPWRCLGRSWHRVSWSWWWCNWAAVPKPRFS